MATVPQPPPKLPALLLALAMVLGTAAGVRAATATWDPNTEPDLAGYRLSYGTQPGVHTFFVDVGLVTTYTFNPPGGQRIYVVVQAYNTAGDLSNKSAEVIVDIPGPPPAPGVPLPVRPSRRCRPRRRRRRPSARPVASRLWHRNRRGRRSRRRRR